MNSHQRRIAKRTEARRQQRFLTQLDAWYKKKYSGVLDRMLAGDDMLMGLIKQRVAARQAPDERQTQ